MASSRLYDLPDSRTGTASGIYYSSIVAVLGCTMLIVWGTTQWAAWRLAFHPNLGPPVFAIEPASRLWAYVAAALATAASGLAATWAPARRAVAPLLLLAGAEFAAGVGPIYPPWEFFVWEWHFGDRPALEPIFRTGHWLIGVPAHLIFLVSMLLAWLRARKAREKTDSHGSAHWATAREAAETGLLTGEGLFVGIWRSGRKVRHLRHGGPQHVLGFAPARSGKGVGWVLPTLLTWPESVLVHDIKGENWALTAGWRSRELGSVCLRFDPTARDGSAARFNPLLEVRCGPGEVRDVQIIADMLVDPDGNGHKDHWDLTAQELLMGLILHVLYSEYEPTLRTCLELLTDPDRPVEDVLEEMLTTEHDPAGERGWLLHKTGVTTRTHPAVAGAARALLNKSDNERSSVISSAVKFLSLFHDDVVVANTSASDFRITDLMHHEKPVSLYLTVPPADIARTRALVRLLIHQIGRRLTERLDFEGGRGVPSYRHRLLLMMDEFPALGRLDFFETQLAYLPGYGIQAFLIVQDLSQLYAAYGHHESIVSNCHVRVAYTPNKIETAQLLSSMAGVMTVHKGRRMYSGNRFLPFLPHVMASDEESQRPLLTADEAMCLPEDSTLVFCSGHRPIHGTKLRYYENPELLRRARVAPPEDSDRILRSAENTES